MKKQLLTLLLLSLLVNCKDENHSRAKEEHEHSKEQIHNEERDMHHDSTEDSNASVLKKSTATLKKELTEKGFQIFDYVDEKTQDTVIMQRYYIAFLKTGPVRNQNEEEAALLQNEHLAHLGKMYELGYADISGPFDDDGDIRGITIYNVPTKAMADSLANADPAVKAGRLEIEIHPWWAAKGFPLR